jgi:hypothetical protein
VKTIFYNIHIKIIFKYVFNLFVVGTSFSVLVHAKFVHIEIGHYKAAIFILIFSFSKNNFNSYH